MEDGRPVDNESLLELLESHAVSLVARDRIYLGMAKNLLRAAGPQVILIHSERKEVISGSTVFTAAPQLRNVKLLG